MNNNLDNTPITGEIMAGGNNSAKKIVIKKVKDLTDSAKDIAKNLQNGKSGDMHEMSRAIALLVESDILKNEMITALYEPEFVTIEECRKQHEKKEVDKSEVELTEVSIGSLHIKGKLNVMIVGMFILAVGVVFAIGKTEGWW